jgi:hypothetical protein
MLHLIAAVFALTASMPSVGRAPVSATGLAAGRTFEGWVRFAASADPRVRGIAMHAGDRIRITFPKAFTPVDGDPTAYLLYGWPQGDADADFTVGRAPGDARTIVISVRSTIAALSPQMPGVKAIHLIAPLRNPEAGTYHLHVMVTLRGRTHSAEEAVRIEAAPRAQLAPFNAMHDGRNEDWQTVHIASRASTDADFLYTDERGDHPANLTLQTVGERPTRASVMLDGARIGEIIASRGLVLVPQAAPRGGVVRVGVLASRTPGSATVTARLSNGNLTVLHLNVVR